ncbi:MAG: glycosyltransferase [Lachnospiraceae bacterium]|nr:glycosyltransferase [Lachnospiraceae bacterium]
MAVKKKILIVNNIIQGGGVEKLMYDLVWYWHEKYEITIMTNYREDAFEQLYPSNVKYLEAYCKNENNGRLIGKISNKIKTRLHKDRLQKQIQQSKFDIAIAIKEGWKMLEVSRLDIPEKYCWVHTDYNNYYYTQGIYDTAENERECMKQFKKIVCVSEDIRKGIIDVIGNPGNLCVKYNPIDIELIKKKAEEELVDVEPETTRGVPRFVTVGRLNYQKGYDLLLEACAMLEKDGLEFEVWIIGGPEPWGDEHNRLYRAHKRLGLKNVKFLGARNNPYKYMKVADWFLSSSLFEGYSLVSQEAAVLDVPMLLTDCSGVRELLGDNEYGIVMDISVQGIYEGMKRVIEHPELHEHYKKKITERKSMITYEERIQEIEKLWEE